MLSHAFGAAFDNPDLIVAAVVGDGEAESGPLAGGLAGHRFLNPARDGAVLPILHLNGYKISGPTVLGRDSDDDIRAFLQGNGYEAHFVEGDDPAARAPGVRRDARPLLRPHPRHPAGGPGARRRRAAALAGHRPAHAEGLDRPEGGRRASRSRAPSAPTRCRWRTRATTRAARRSSRRGCASYEPEALFDADGRLVPELAALAPQGRPPHERQPARQRRQAAGGPRPPRLPRLRRRGRAGLPWCGGSPPASSASMLRDVYVRNAEDGELPPVLPRRDELEPPRQRLRGREPLLRRPHARHRRPRLAGRPGHGGAQRAPLRGLAGGVHADRPARAVRDLRGVRDGLGVDDRAAHEVAPGSASTCPGGRPSRRSTSCSRRPAGATTTTASATRGPA